MDWLTESLRACKLCSLTISSAVPARAITMRTIDARFMAELLLVNGRSTYILFTLQGEETQRSGGPQGAPLPMKAVHSFGSGKADAVSTLIVDASALVTP